MMMNATTAVFSRFRPAGAALLALICAVHAVDARAAEQAQDEPAIEIPEPVRQDLSYKVGKGLPIEVINAYGDVNVRFGGYEDSLDMHTTLQQPEGAAAIAMKPSVREGRYLVEPRLPAGVELAKGQRLDLVVYVPQGHALTVRTTFGTIESRNAKSDIDLNSTTGKVAIRGNEGMVRARSEEGNVTAILTIGARPGSSQSFSSRTGRVSVEVTDALNAEVSLSTSNQFTTDYSLEVEHRDGEEPNKRARAVVGTPLEGKEKALMSIESLVGEVRLLRRAVFVDPE